MTKVQRFKLQSILIMFYIMLIWQKLKHVTYEYLLWVAKKHGDHDNIMHCLVRLLVCNEIIVELCDTQIIILEKLEENQ